MVGVIWSFFINGIVSKQRNFLFSGSGQLSEKELRAALVNGDWTSFDPHTVRMMIR